MYKLTDEPKQTETW